MFVDVIQNSIEGLANGAAYGLIALGFTLMFGVIGRLNLAYGAIIMVGLYAGVYVHIQWDVHWLLVASIVLLASVIAGIYVERLCFAPMRDGLAMTSLVASFAIWMQLEEAAMLALPRHSYSFPTPTKQVVIDLGPFMLRGDHLVTIGVALLIMIGLERLVHHSRFGTSLRAIAENPRAARFVGHHVQRSLFTVFVLTSVIGGVAGWLIASSNQQVSAMFGMWATYKGLVAAMLGGLGSMRGALAGGLLLGLVEAYALWLFGPQIRDLTASLLLFFLIVIRPGGLFGQAQVLQGAAARRRL